MFVLYQWQRLGVGLEYLHKFSQIITKLLLLNSSCRFCQGSSFIQLSLIYFELNISFRSLILSSWVLTYFYPAPLHTHWWFSELIQICRQTYIILMVISLSGESFYIGWLWRLAFSSRVLVCWPWQSVQQVFTMACFCRWNVSFLILNAFILQLWLYYWL